MVWPVTDITINETQHKAIAPFIISASRATDIPSHYACEFINGLKTGYIHWRNPFNGKISLIDLSKVKFIVFWTKNAAPIIPMLDVIDKLNIRYYFNYTLNDYENEGFETKLPGLEKRIQTFAELSQRIGKEKVVWRFDPIIITQDLSVQTVLERIEKLARQIHPFTQKLVFSFVDIKYRKLKINFARKNVSTTDLSPEMKMEFAEKLHQLISPFGLQIATCAEPLDLSETGIFQNRCIDPVLISQIARDDEILMNFIESARKKNKLKDKSQRKYCGCMISKDIGAYNTCLGNCLYCYAGSKPEK